jgi:hypothetical protein
MMLPKPRDVTNLVVPVAVSASHVAFNGVRLGEAHTITAPLR